MRKILAILTILNLTSSLFSSPSKEKVDALYNAVPQSCEAMESYTQNALQNLESAVEKFLHSEIRDFEHTILQWHEILAHAFSNQQVLTGTASTENKSCAQFHAQKIGEAMQQAMENPAVLQVLLEFAEKHSSKDSLSPLQRTYVFNVIKSINTNLLSPDLKDKVESLQQTLSSQTKLAYTHLKGKGSAKKDAKTLSVLSFNTCCLWDMLPMIWGGILPWELRIDELAKKIKEQNADLICFQEIFDFKASTALYEKLKGSYKYFYINIGPRNFGLSPGSFGLSSGLFVASRYEIQKPKFIAFGKNSPPERTYGFFFGNLLHQEQVIAQFVTTHLQPFNSSEGKSWRNKQIKQILTFMRSQEPINVPFLLCGDLNTEWRSKEPAESLLSQNFYNSYRPSDKTLKTRTCADYTNYWWKDQRDIKKFRAKPEIIDYCLLLQKTNKQGIEKKFPMKTQIISMSKPHLPEKALSDHQAVMTWIQLPTRIDNKF
ncbi:MAG: endonuclease/exonuclease/phosphatase family protein [Rhabdochlamydiaceae bacterium]|nr:endonuclease/exonuclease/phosphatase family protein [Rhabdochlamydiaceae bacterium]